MEKRKRFDDYPVLKEELRNYAKIINFRDLLIWKLSHNKQKYLKIIEIKILCIKYFLRITICIWCN